MTQHVLLWHCVLKLLATVDYMLEVLDCVLKVCVFIVQEVSY
jgi:hypothetical protein